MRHFFWVAFFINITTLTHNSHAQNMDSKYLCVSEIYTRYDLNKDKFSIKRGDEAKCHAELLPSLKTWNTDCPFFRIRKSYDIEVLNFESGFGFWTIKIIAINRNTTVIKTMVVTKLKNIDDLRFEATVGGNIRYGTCVVK
jgi:hypothetical protein